MDAFVSQLGNATELIVHALMEASLVAGELGSTAEENMLVVEALLAAKSTRLPAAKRCLTLLAMGNVGSHAQELQWQVSEWLLSFRLSYVGRGSRLQAKALLLSMKASPRSAGDDARGENKARNVQEKTWRQCLQLLDRGGRQLMELVMHGVELLDAAQHDFDAFERVPATRLSGLASLLKLLPLALSSMSFLHVQRSDCVEECGRAMETACKRSEQKLTFLRKDKASKALFDPYACVQSFIKCWWPTPLLTSVLQAMRDVFQVLESAQASMAGTVSKLMQQLSEKIYCSLSLSPNDTTPLSTDVAVSSLVKTDACLVLATELAFYLDMLTKLNTGKRKADDIEHVDEYSTQSTTIQMLARLVLLVIVYSGREYKRILHKWFQCSINGNEANLDCFALQLEILLHSIDSHPQMHHSTHSVHCLELLLLIADSKMKGSTVQEVEEIETNIENQLRRFLEKSFGSDARCGTELRTVFADILACDGPCFTDILMSKAFHWLLASIENRFTSSFER